jgi:hypothetical protein
LHTIIDVALAWLLGPAIQFSITRPHIHALSVEQLKRRSSSLHAFEKRLEDLHGVTLLHFGATVYGYYIGQTISPVIELDIALYDY